MRKLFTIIATACVALSLTACGEKSESDTLKVSCTLDPHSRILEAAKPILKEKYDLDLEITVLDNYYIFNRALNDGEVDANYFQHLPFFEGEVKNNGYDIVNAGGIHIEPFGFYSNTIKDPSELTNGAKVVISNSVADHGRILRILEGAGLIVLEDNVSTQDATLEDIKENPLNLKFIEVNPELLTLALQNNEGDLVAINGNYAIQAGLNPTKDAVILEQADQDNPYVNIVACRTEDKDSAKIKALVEVLQSEEIKEFIENTYTDGSVIPAN